MPTSDASVSADALRKARLRKGLTQAGAAERLGIDVMRISTWERGLSEPRPALIPQLAALYEVPPDKLLTRHTRSTLLGARLVRGLTVAQVAAEIGVAGSTYHRFERQPVNLRTLDPAVVPALAACLGLTNADTQQRLSR